MQPLLAEPRQDFTEAEVLATLDLTNGVKVRHGVDVLDTSDRLLTETVPLSADDGGEVSWSYRPPDGATADATATAQGRMQGRLTLVGDVTVPIVARRFRPWTELLSPAGNWVRWWLMVGVATLPPVDDDGHVVRTQLVLADKTIRYAREIEEPVNIAPSTGLVDYVKTDLGSRFGETRFSFPTSTVTNSIGMTFLPPATWHDVYNAVLQAAGCDQLTCDWNGRPSTVLLSTIAARGPEATYGPNDSKIVRESSVEPLDPDLPNVIRFVARKAPALATEGNGIKTVKNQSTGPGSIDARGEERIRRVDVDADNETQLEQIAAADAQRYFAGGGLRFVGKIGLNPSHADRDVIGLDKPTLGLSGTWNLTDWSYPLRRIDSADAVLMPITAERRV